MEYRRSEAVNTSPSTVCSVTGQYSSQEPPRYPLWCFVPDLDDARLRRSAALLEVGVLPEPLVPG